MYQAAIIKRKKETTAEKLNDVRATLLSAEEEIMERRQQIQVTSSCNWDKICHLESSCQRKRDDKNKRMCKDIETKVCLCFCVTSELVSSAYITVQWIWWIFINQSLLKIQRRPRYAPVVLGSFIHKTRHGAPPPPPKPISRKRYDVTD